MPVWKKILLWGFSVGGGLAVAGALILGGFVWYSSRPSKPQPWNKAAIKVTFERLGVISNTFAFYYTLENLTDHDYSLAETQGLKLMEMDEKGDLVIFGFRDSANGEISNIADTVTYDLPVFLPANQRLHNYAIRIKIVFSDEQKRKPSESDESFSKRLAAGIDQLGFSGRWVLFDEKNRIQIDFPRGW
jgi:hypothetical protein